MCGIAGSQGNIDVNIEQWQAKLSHRGPDAMGSYKDGDTILVSTRLSIQDITAVANQPMSNEDETVWIVFNGEIYNAPHLRAELRKLGHVFKSRSDTEVLVHMYEAKGIEMLSQLRGMFAFAIYDNKNREIFLARDPFGIKPLVYWAPPTGFAFSSELKAIVKIPEFDRELDRDSLLLYLRINYIPAPWTIWKNVRKLNPGHFMRVKNGSIIEDTRYHRQRVDPWDGTFEDALSVLEAQLKDSVYHHLLSDVSVGAFLSGGLDSSLISAMAQLCMEKPLKTYTVSFPEISLYDESKYARIAADHIGTDHTEIPVSVKEAVDSIGEMSQHLDEPFGDSSLVPLAIMSKATGRSVKVALSGDGGDELFGGYNKYQGMRLAELFNHLSPFIKMLTKLPITGNRGTYWGNKLRQLERLDYVMDFTPLDRLIRLMHVFRDNDFTLLVGEQSTDRLLLDKIEKLWERGKELFPRDEVNIALFVDSRFVLPFDMLFKVDMASMRYGLEVRVPFIDIGLVDFLFSLPGKWKLRGLKRKYILKKIAEKYLPPEIINRPKGGFDIPIGEWIRNQLSDLFRETLAPEKVKQVEELNPKYVGTLLNDHISRKKERFWELWNLFVLLRWFESQR